MPRIIDAPAVLVAHLAQQRQLEDTVANLEEQLKDAKAQLKLVSEHETVEHVEPDLLADDVLVRLPDGSCVKFEQKVHCGVNAADRQAAHLWLQEHGHGALLKRSVTLQLGKDSKQRVAKLNQLLQTFLPHFEIQVLTPARGDQSLKSLVEYLCAEAGIDKPTIEEDTELPGATLASFVKKQLHLGAELPDFFNVYAPVKAVTVPEPDTWQDDAGWWFRRPDETLAGPFTDEATAHEAFAEMKHTTNLADDRPAIDAVIN